VEGRKLLVSRDSCPEGVLDDFVLVAVLGFAVALHQGSKIRLPLLYSR